MPKYRIMVDVDTPLEFDALVIMDQIEARVGAENITVSEPVLIESHEEIVIYVDGGGGHHSKNFLGAWAFVGKFPGKAERVEKFGIKAKTTNNQMEITAVLEALKATPEKATVQIICDSKYVIDGCTKWRWNWVKRGWVNYEGKPVANRELWEQMFPLLDSRKVKFHHVKGHTGVEGNERCDALCTAAIATEWERIKSEAKSET